MQCSFKNICNSFVIRILIFNQASLIFYFMCIAHFFHYNNIEIEKHILIVLLNNDSQNLYLNSRVLIWHARSACILVSKQQSTKTQKYNETLNREPLILVARARVMNITNIISIISIFSTGPQRQTNAAVGMCAFAVCSSQTHRAPRDIYWADQTRLHKFKEKPKVAAACCSLALPQPSNLKFQKQETRAQPTASTKKN